LDEEHLTNMVAFHSHQAIEKCFKAVAEQNEISVKKIHNLVTLVSEIKRVIHLEYDDIILKELNEIYISARYPSDLGLMPYGKPTMTDARRFFSSAKSIYNQITSLQYSVGSRQSASGPVWQAQPDRRIRMPIGAFPTCRRICRGRKTG